MGRDAWRRALRWLAILALAALLEALYFLYLAPAPERRPPPLDDAQLQAIAAQVAAAWRDSAPAAPPAASSGEAWESVYLAAWQAGRRLGEGWGGAGMPGLQQALGRVRAAGSTGPDAVELSLACCFRLLDAQNLGDELSAAQRGVRGLEVSLGERVVRYAPSQMIADNLSFERALGRAAQTLGADGRSIVEEARLRSFEATQVTVQMGQAPRAQQLFRGQHPVPIASVTRPGVLALRDNMAQWMWRNLHDDGRMTYLYYPGSGRESQSNNMIRQWMATLAMVRQARRSGDAGSLQRVRRNIDYNLARFYRREGELGLIEYRGQVKLGAVALAALALLELPGGGYEVQRDALVATTDRLWRESGEFRNFLLPAARNADANFHNFYPGEALLLWATLLHHAADPERARRYQQSVRHYRAWHGQNRRPAFVPWQTQAAYLRWQASGAEALAAWIFDMNDWLLGMQARSELAYPDTRGRFYDPQRPHFGPPHASSTGVYLEGLVDAWELAVQLGDERRAARYRQSIVEGLRSAMQLQFSNDGSMWFVAEPARVRGGLRTTVYNNVIRVDNVQHTLLAVEKILAADARHAGLLPGGEGG